MEKFAVALTAVVSCTIVSNCAHHVETISGEKVLEGFIVVHRPTILFFETREDRDEEDWGKCHNIAADLPVLKAAQRLQRGRVRIRVREIDPPVAGDPKDVYTKTVVQGQLLVPWCVQETYYFATAISR